VVASGMESAIGIEKDGYGVFVSVLDWMSVICGALQSDREMLAC